MIGRLTLDDIASRVDLSRPDRAADVTNEEVATLLAELAHIRGCLEREATFQEGRYEVRSRSFKPHEMAIADIHEAVALELRRMLHWSSTHNGIGQGFNPARTLAVVPQWILDWAAENGVDVEEVAHRMGFGGVYRTEEP